ncbi:hypothetical protein GA0061094_1914 [[Bacillus] enclensis]|jgi:hypothetical protein|uniref:Uncharacterized protein n=2 Tax=Rossellomorea TaxID=2837508 RepID=A0A1C4B5P2_9BACI|nr:hypothetical protein [[Bacillus] enclensis]SCC02221.1 hypothetical protein GA0061094_1914 [[Bacillus] enclensis]
MKNKKDTVREEFGQEFGDVNAAKLIEASLKENKQHKEDKKKC